MLLPKIVIAGLMLFAVAVNVAVSIAVISDGRPALALPCGACGMLSLWQAVVAWKV